MILFQSLLLFFLFSPIVRFFLDVIGLDILFFEEIEDEVAVLVEETELMLFYFFWEGGNILFLLVPVLIVLLSGADELDEVAFGVAVVSDEAGVRYSHNLLSGFMPHSHLQVSVVVVLGVVQEVKLFFSLGRPPRLLLTFTFTISVKIHSLDTPLQLLKQLPLLALLCDLMLHSFQ